MAKLKDLKDLVQNVNLTEEQIAELLTIIIDMKKKNENAEKGKVVLPPELVALLEKCTINRGEELVCPLCGSTSVNKNGKKDGRQRYLCKSCVKTFGDTYGTLLYHSKLTVKQWIEFLTLTLYNASLNRIKKDMGINLATAWYNRHKVCSLIMQLEGEQDSFPSIVEGDEFFIPLSFIGERNKAFFIEELKRMPRHHRNRAEKFEYIEQAGYEIAEVEDMDGFYDDETIPSNLSVSKELNGLDKEEKRKRGISNEQVCVITAVDKLQNAYLAPTCLGKIEPKHLELHLGGRFAEDSILVTDSLRAYRTFANNNKIHLRQIPSGRHTSGPFNLGKVNSYHSKLTDYFERYKEVGSKYLDHYLALFRWQEKGFNSRTADRVNMLLDMLTKGVPEKVEFQKLKYRPFPFDTKNIVRVVTISA